MQVGQECNQIINRDVLNDISRAVISLHTDILYIEKNEAIEIVEEMISTSKKVVECYIDQQKTTLMKLIDAV
jgi:hypothetical protein